MEKEREFLLVRLKSCLLHSKKLFLRAVPPPRLPSHAPTAYQNEIYELLDANTKTSGYKPAKQ